MRKSKFTAVQNAAILVLLEHGVKVADICWGHGIGQPTFYQWQRKYSGMEISEFNRLKEMAQELALFKRIVADLTIKNRVLKGVIEIKLSVRPKA